MLTFAPKDRTKREHIGQLDRVTYFDSDREFVIIKLKGGASMLGNGTPEQFVQGQNYVFHGRWNDGKMGPEFRFETVTKEIPHGKNAVVKYLSETCRNIGKVTAEKIFEKFGGEGVRLLREEPLKIANAGFLSPDAAKEAAQDLERFVHIERTKVQLFGLFAGRGFSGKAIDRAISTWGVRAPEVIKANPFTLLIRKFPSVGFKRADKLYLDLGKAANSLKRQAMCGYQAMKEDRSGSTWLDADEAAKKINDTVPGSDPYRALVLLRRAGWIRVRREGNSRFVAPRDRADAEQRIADNVRRLSQFPSLWPTSILASAVEGDGLPSAHQVDQLRLATVGPIGCFVGGPGTGKTHTLAFLLKQLIAEHGPESVAVAAPTGKAAVRAGESLRARGLGIVATTIHRLLEIGRNGHDGDGWGFQRDRDNPLDIRFVVIDESSMIDTGLMADVLDAVPDGACVLLVGDPYQLPPVGHGAPLRDLLAARIPQGELIEVRRNAGSIVRGCAAIKAGTPCEFDDEFDLDAEDKKNLRILDVRAVESLDTLQEVLTNMTRFDPAWECQIIVPLNDKSDLSRKKINERFGKLLNPDGFRNPKNQFAVGDKIICLRNTKLKIVDPIALRWGNDAMAFDAANYQPRGGSRDEAEWYVANGEIGRVVAVSEKQTIARFGGSEVPLVSFANAKKRDTEDDDDRNPSGIGADFDLAWAITVHRSQGSEWPCVICLIDDAGSLICDRNYWYTAFSRARTACLPIGPKSVFDRQVKRVQLNRRRTFLVELLA